MTPASRLLEWLAPQPGEHVLDLGCGLGHHAAALAALGALVTGIDPEAHLLEQARLACPRGEFHTAGLFDFAPARPFDAIFAHAVLHWIAPPHLAAQRLFELLRPGGRIVGSFGARAAEAPNLLNYYLPDAAQCRELLLSAGFTSIHVEEAAHGLLFRAVRPVTG